MNTCSEYNGEDKDPQDGGNTSRPGEINGDTDGSADYGKAEKSVQTKQRKPRIPKANAQRSVEPLHSRRRGDREGRFDVPYTVTLDEPVRLLFRTESQRYGLFRPDVNRIVNQISIEQLALWFEKNLPKEVNGDER